MGRHSASIKDKGNLPNSNQAVQPGQPFNQHSRPTSTAVQPEQPSNQQYPTSTAVQPGQPWPPAGRNARAGILSQADWVRRYPLGAYPGSPVGLHRPKRADLLRVPLDSDREICVYRHHGDRALLQTSGMKPSNQLRQHAFEGCLASLVTETERINTEKG